MSVENFLEVLAQDRTVAVVRAAAVPDPAALCQALVNSGIRSVELTFTIPGVLDLIKEAVSTAAQHGATVGVGTVLTGEQARTAIDAGAQFLVTPGLRRDVARVASNAGIPFALGVLTPSEVAEALDLGSTAIKIFPARQWGPGYLKDLQGPFPGIKLLPSGGIDASNAADYLRAGALAVGCGTSVVPPSAIEAGDWAHIGSLAQNFVASLGAR